MNIPANGSIIIFTRKPAGSYASEGVTYRVEHYGRRTIALTNVATGAETQDVAAMYSRAIWHAAA